MPSCIQQHPLHIEEPARILYKPVCTLGVRPQIKTLFSAKDALARHNNPRHLAVREGHQQRCQGVVRKSTLQLNGVTHGDVLCFHQSSWQEWAVGRAGRKVAILGYKWHGRAYVEM